MNFFPFIRKITAILLLLVSGCFPEREQVLFFDDFSDLESGMFSGDVVGAHAEYHYIKATAPKGNWVVSCFRSNASQRAWRVIRNEHMEMAQTYTASRQEQKYTHPMIIAGDSLWKDYTLEVRFMPGSDAGQSGMLFRYRNDRCYYFFGVDGQKAVVKRVRHEKSLRTADELILAESPFSWKPGEILQAKVTVKGTHIAGEINGQVFLEADDAAFQKGKIGLTSDIPTRFQTVRVMTSGAGLKQFNIARRERQEEIRQLQSKNPKMVFWKKIVTDGFGADRNVRFGDLNNDGQPDILIGQVKHHGPKDTNSEVACLTALTFDGKRLWQNGVPDLWKNQLTNDVAFQIHDLDGDGRAEVVYTRDFEIVVADGATGKTKFSSPTPLNKCTDPPYDRFRHILGDCLFFCDVRGKGHDGDIVIKDRYQHFWVLDDRLNLLWEGACKTGHYPFAFDTDGDGRDELVIGYSLYDDDGTLVWSKDSTLEDHCDGVAVARFDDRPDARPVIMNAASDVGMLFIGLDGEILRHHHLGHVQNPAVANFRDDLPGLETVSINFWANQGIIHFFDSRGDLYHDCEPVQHGSMMLPINWTGSSEEFFVLSASAKEGGLYDGWGRCVVRFPEDGHPELCNAVLDITGDPRDEIVVWDPHEIWVYTQANNPVQGRIYQPVRNPLYNSSNYQASVSLPGWSE